MAAGDFSSLVDGKGYGGKSGGKGKNGKGSGKDYRGKFGGKGKGKDGNGSKGGKLGSGRSGKEGQGGKGGFHPLDESEADWEEEAWEVGTWEDESWQTGWDDWQSSADACAASEPGTSAGVSTAGMAKTSTSFGELALSSFTELNSIGNYVTEDSNGNKWLMLNCDSGAATMAITEVIGSPTEAAGEFVVADGK